MDDASSTKPLSDDDEAVVRLEHILNSWTNKGPSAPHKIVYLLDDQYARPNFRFDALTGHDALLVALVDAVAARCGFRVGLATVKHHVQGAAELEDPYYNPRHDYPDSDDEDSSSPEPVKYLMGDIIDSDTTLLGLGDLHGRVVFRATKCTEDETIPEDLYCGLEPSVPDKEKVDVSNRRVSPSEPGLSLR